MAHNVLEKNAYFFGFMMLQESKYWDTTFEYSFNPEESLYISKQLLEDEIENLHGNLEEEIFDKLNLPGREEFISFLIKDILGGDKNRLQSLDAISIAIDFSMEGGLEFSQFSFNLNFNDKNYKFSSYINCLVSFWFKKEWDPIKRMHVPSSVNVALQLNDSDMRSRVVISSMLHSYIKKYLEDFSENEELRDSLSFIKKAMKDKFVDYDYDNMFLYIPKPFLREYLFSLGYNDLIMVLGFDLAEEQPASSQALMQLNVYCNSFLSWGKDYEHSVAPVPILFTLDNTNQVKMQIDPQFASQLVGARVVYDIRFKKGFRKFIEGIIKQREKKAGKIETGIKNQIIQLIEDFFMKI